MKTLYALLICVSVAAGQETGRLILRDSIATTGYYKGGSSFYVQDTLLSVRVDTTLVRISYPMKWLWIKYVGVKEVWCIARTEVWRLKCSYPTYTYFDEDWKPFTPPKIYFRWAN